MFSNGSAKVHAGNKLRSRLERAKNTLPNDAFAHFYCSSIQCRCCAACLCDQKHAAGEMEKKWEVIGGRKVNVNVSFTQTSIPSLLVPAVPAQRQDDIQDSDILHRSARRKKRTRRRSHPEHALFLFSSARVGFSR